MWRQVNVQYHSQIWRSGLVQVLYVFTIKLEKVAVVTGAATSIDGIIEVVGVAIFPFVGRFIVN